MISVACKNKTTTKALNTTNKGSAMRIYLLNLEEVKQMARNKRVHQDHKVAELDNQPVRDDEDKNEQPYPDYIEADKMHKAIRPRSKDGGSTRRQ